MAEPRKLSGPQIKVLEALEERKEPIGFAAISLWELARMHQAGLLDTVDPLEIFLHGIETHPLIAVIPLSATIAAESVALPEGFHKDPADRLIVATSRCHNLRLLTADKQIRKWGKVPLV
ncbi:MAG: type II toxin-antitoxin system VapC family toxin [Deltaproteobacteria bacterium]|nr:type II toxin-antitoxin system VapC family toxin [Deltaproteobacteria bacterium]